MKKKDQKSINKNLENQSVDTDKVQGGLKIAYTEYVNEKDGFQDTISPDVKGVSKKAEMRKGARNMLNKPRSNS